LRTLLAFTATLLLAFAGCGKSQPTTTSTSGACCAPAGTCTITTSAGCPSPNTWLGAGTTCSSCGPPGGVPWLDPITPARALTNVRVTFSAKAVPNYDRSLADDFTFVPAPADLDLVSASGDPTFFDNWTKQRELAAFTSVFLQSPGTVSFAWGPPDPDTITLLSDGSDPGGGEYYPHLKYQMLFQRSGADTAISGFVDLYVRQQAAGWQIYRWVDQQDGSANATLGLVRWRGRVVY
jgi:hypothetical protein